MRRHRPPIGRGTRENPFVLPTGSGRSQRRPLDSVGGWARGHPFDSGAADGPRSRRTDLRFVARGQRPVGRRRDDALCAGETMGQRRHARLGLRRGRSAHARVAAYLSLRAPPSLDRRAGQGSWQLRRPAFSSTACNRIGSGGRGPRFRWLGSNRLKRRRWTEFAKSIAEILQDVSGETIDPAATATFLELGFDSLLLSQVAQQIQRRLRVKIAFRQLLGDLSTIPALERFIRAEAPAEVKRPVATAAPRSGACGRSARRRLPSSRAAPS